MVTLMTQWYFEECLKSKIPEPQPGGINAHNLFNLKGIGENQVPLSRYFTCDITIGGMVVPDVGVLIKTDRILTTSKGVKTKVPVIIGCNVFKHAARKFIQDYGEMALELFECPKEIDPLFSLVWNFITSWSVTVKLRHQVQRRERPMTKEG